MRDRSHSGRAACQCVTDAWCNRYTIGPARYRFCGNYPGGYWAAGPPANAFRTPVVIVTPLGLLGSRCEQPMRFEPRWLSLHHWACSIRYCVQICIKWSKPVWAPKALRRVFVPKLNMVYVFFFGFRIFSATRGITQKTRAIPEPTTRFPTRLFPATGSVFRVLSEGLAEL